MSALVRRGVVLLQYHRWMRFTLFCLLVGAWVGATVPLAAHAAGAPLPTAADCLGPVSRVLEAPTDGAEVLLLEGSLHDGTALQPQGSWIRLPGDEGRALVAGPAGATLYLKTGHLPGQTQPTQPGGSSR